MASGGKLLTPHDGEVALHACWRRADKRAAVAVAHSILVIAYHILDRGQPYAELGGDWLLKRESASAHAKRLVHQLEWG